jgi:ubiquinone/menaquinone biosynthesis C-methylase UbiE
LRGLRVLCLAARLGGEVRAFIDLGALAIGIDLNPGIGNRYVVHGDFHHLQYADNTFDVVFTNSLDHALDVPRIMDEARRVLADDGMFIVEASAGRESYAPKTWEALTWANLDDLVTVIEQGGFRLESRSEVDELWPGEQLRFRSTAGGI